MNYLKKAVLVCLTFILTAILAQPVGAEINSVESSPNKRLDLTLTAENCNIILEYSIDEQFHYDYDKTLFVLTEKDSGTGKTIEVCKKDGIETDRPPKFVTIQIPNTEYNHMYCNLKAVGVSIPAMNSDVKIIAEGSAVTATVPEGFSKTLSYHSKQGAGSVNLQKGADVGITMKAETSAVKVPENWPAFYSGQSYTHQPPEATGKVDIALEGCAFTIQYL